MGSFFIYYLMSIFSQRDPSDITADTFHLLRNSLDFCERDISVKTRVDRLLNRVYYWYLQNVGLNGEGYSVSAHNVCHPEPGHGYWGEEKYYEDNEHGWHPELAAFIDELEDRGFQCRVDTLNNRIDFSW